MHMKTFCFFYSEMKALFFVNRGISKGKSYDGYQKLVLIREMMTVP